MKDFWKRNKTYLTISIYLIAIGLIGIFVARPMVLVLREKSNQIQQKIAIQESKEGKLKELPAIRSQFEGAKNQEEIIAISLSEENVVSLVEKLEKISEETGNEIKMELTKKEGDAGKESVSKSKKKEGEDDIVGDLPSDKYVKMKISLNGRYGNFLNFLNKIENMEFYADVISVSIKRASESGSGLSVNPFNALNSSSDKENKPEDKNAIISQLEVVFYLENK